jgi:RNA polymerase sigma-70 factor (ECF subfamily)
MTAWPRIPIDAAADNRARPLAEPLTATPAGLTADSPGLAQAKANEVRLRAQLLAGLDGDAAAYQAFLKGLSAHLRAFLRRRLSALPDDIEDLVQDTLLAVHNQRHTYRTDQPLTAWVQAIARYKLVDLLRSRAGREALHDPLDDDLAVFAADDHAASDARRDLMQLLDQLPDHHRLPIVHTKLEGLSVAEAAQRTGMSESAIKVGVHRGLKALADRLKKGIA